jgi:hypothetical protein
MNLSGRGAPGQKQASEPPDPAYIGEVKALDCRACGRHGPSDAHHCRDKPDFDERGLYSRLPAMRRKSGDRDAIPLCTECHWLFHNRRGEFHALYGKDYRMIASIRSALDDETEE